MHKVNSAKSEKQCPEVPEMAMQIKSAEDPKNTIISIRDQRLVMATFFSFKAISLHLSTSPTLHS